MGDINRDRLRELVNAPGRTPRAVSRAVGTNAYLVRDILSSKSKNPRADTMARLADHLGVPVEEIMPSATHTADRISASAQIVPAFLPVRHRVQAGLWHEVDDSAQDFVAPPQPVIPDSKYADFGQWLELVEGDSIDRKIAPGGFAHVVDAIGMGYRARDGDYVVVERRRSGGALRERSIKQVAIGPRGEVELWPRSTNPRWSSPLQVDEPQNGEDIEVEIVGLVIGAYATFRQGN